MKHKVVNQDVAAGWLRVARVYQGLPAVPEVCLNDLGRLTIKLTQPMPVTGGHTPDPWVEVCTFSEGDVPSDYMRHELHEFGKDLPDDSPLRLEIAYILQPYIGA
jgi:hypothetical protein